MGINTDILQAAMVSRVRVKANVPSKITADLNMADGNFKINALPVSLPDDVALAVE